MIMFTAGSACLVYSRFGHILYDYAAVLLVLGFLITLCSQLLTFLLIKLLGRRSIIVFMMVSLMVSLMSLFECEYPMSRAGSSRGVQARP